MNKDLVSILIPTYDRPSYLRIALASAFNQTYKNIEVIVVDDSPNDLSKNICNEYGTKIKYYHRKDKGITLAYKYGRKIRINYPYINSVMDRLKILKIKSEKTEKK